MIIGFTGTREGMSQRQKDALFTLLWNLGHQNEFHHGDCVGADEHARNIANMVGMKIVQHPPDVSTLRAFCDDPVILDPAPYHERNRAIVNAAQLVIAAPKTRHEVRKSGTWSTVRYARRLKKEVVIVDP